jgi:hypothetical protein
VSGPVDLDKLVRACGILRKQRAASGSPSVPQKKPSTTRAASASTTPPPEPNPGRNVDVVDDLVDKAHHTGSKRYLTRPHSRSDLPARIGHRDVVSHDRPKRGQPPPRITFRPSSHMYCDSVVEHVRPVYVDAATVAHPVTAMFAAADIVPWFESMLDVRRP